LSFIRAVFLINKYIRKLIEWQLLPGLYVSGCLLTKIFIYGIAIDF
jgi:hypothetical protein